MKQKKKKFIPISKQLNRMERAKRRRVYRFRQNYRRRLQGRIYGVGKSHVRISRQRLALYGRQRG